MEETFSEKHDRLTDEALTQILPIYGEVMFSWATIEDAMCDWFEYLSGMKHGQARAVFFSARSFAGRADMLDALLSVPAGKPNVTYFVRAAHKKCLCYNSARNMVAHRVPIINASDPEMHVVELNEGGKYPFPSGTPILKEQLSTIAENYRKLIGIMRRAWLLKDSDIPPSERRVKLQEYLEQVLLLPNEADSSEPSRNQRGRARQRRSSRK